jgi:alpha-1,6-mannosyltransferase
MMVSHESLTGLLREWGVPPVLGDRIADRLNTQSASSYDRIVCTTDWAAAEFRRIGAPNLTQVPLGVDLESFHPAHRDPALRARYARNDEVLVVHCSRLSPEKKPELAIDALAELRAAGVPAVLVVLGDGPRRAALAERAAGLPVRFAGFVPDRAAVAGLLATADVAVAPGPVETFGLAGLEALACGTPVVVNAASALPEVIGTAGVAAAGTGKDLAAGIRELLARPEAQRRAAARARAEGFGWPASVEGFLRAHDVAPVHR